MLSGRPSQRGLNIRAELGLEIVKRIEATFVAQPTLENQPERSAIEIARKPREVRFEARLFSPECRPHPEVHGGSPGDRFVVDVAVRDIDAPKQSGDAVHVHVRGGETEGAPPMIAVNDQALYLIRPAQETLHRGQVSAIQRRADPRGTDAFALVKDRVYLDGLEPPFAQRPQRGHIPGPKGSKPKAMANHHRGRSYAFDQGLLDELRRGQAGHRIVEPQVDEFPDADLAKPAFLGRASLDAGRSAVRRNHRCGMGVERKGGRNDRRLSRRGYTGLEKARMAEVDTVEVSDRDRARPRVRGAAKQRFDTKVHPVMSGAYLDVGTGEGDGVTGAAWTVKMRSMWSGPSGPLASTR